MNETMSTSSSCDLLVFALRGSVYRCYTDTDIVLSLYFLFKFDYYYCFFANLW